MIIYLACFAFSVLFAYFAQNVKSKKFTVLFSILSIVITVALAGLRDISVGTDTSHYYENMWMNALRSRSLLRFIETYNKYYASKEYIYALMIGIVAKTTGNFHVYLTLVHLIIVGGVYIGAYRLRKYADPAFTLLLFYLLYYNHSLNIFRQYMAMAIIFATLADILNGHHRRYIIAVLIAILIHNSSIIGFLIIILYYLLYPQKKLRDVSIKYRILLYCFIIVGALLFQPVARILISIGLGSSKFLSYLNSEGFNTYIVARVLIIIEFICILAYFKSFRKYHFYSTFFLMCSFVFGVLYNLAPSIPYGKRIPAYFSLVNLVTIGYLSKCQCKHENKIIIKIIAVFVALSYWLLMYGRYNTSRTIPYLFGTLV